MPPDGIFWSKNASNSISAGAPPKIPLEELTGDPTATGRGRGKEGKMKWGKGKERETGNERQGREGKGEGRGRRACPTSKNSCRAPERAAGTVSKNRTRDPLTAKGRNMDWTCVGHVAGQLQPPLRSAAGRSSADNTLRRRALPPSASPRSLGGMSPATAELASSRRPAPSGSGADSSRWRHRHVTRSRESPTRTRTPSPGLWVVSAARSWSV